MLNIIVELSKYVMILMITMYTFTCFSIFGFQDPDKKRGMLRNQNVLMFMIHIIAFLVMYLETNDIRLLAFYLMQVVLFGATILLYTLIYPKVSRLVINNMCMLLCIGMIMLTRLDYASAVKQFVIAAGAIAISLVVPVAIRKFKRFSEWRNFYAIVGIISLAAVIVVGRVSGGRHAGLYRGGDQYPALGTGEDRVCVLRGIQLQAVSGFKNIVATTALAAFHVLILVVSKDLGAALIIFVVYLVMLYVATRQPLYILAGLGAGSAASVVAYYLFNHVRVRVLAWKDPFAVYDNGGYQVAQSLFAIGTGSWFGMGLFQGAPETIPVAVSDFIFSAIAEEMGLIFALCMILVCVSCYVMFLNIAMQLHTMFYKLVALGLGTCYIFQVFLNVGGVTKFIPSTGVTLPLVSYGGKFAFEYDHYVWHHSGDFISCGEDEEEDLERRKKERVTSRERRKKRLQRKEQQRELSRKDRKEVKRQEKRLARKKARQKQRVR